MTDRDDSADTPGDRLRALREARGLSQQGLAERMGGVSWRTILRLEKGETELRPKRRTQLAAALRAPESYFDGYIGLQQLGLADPDRPWDLPAENAPAPAAGHLEYDAADFFADVLLTMQQVYTQEGVPIGARELASAAYQTHREIVAEAASPEVRDAEFAKQVRALRRHLRQHRIDILKARGAADGEIKSAG